MLLSSVLAQGDITFTGRRKSKFGGYIARFSWHNSSKRLEILSFPDPEFYVCRIIPYSDVYFD